MSLGWPFALAALFAVLWAWVGTVVRDSRGTRVFAVITTALVAVGLLIVRLVFRSDWYFVRGFVSVFGTAFVVTLEAHVVVVELLARRSAMSFASRVLWAAIFLFAISAAIVAALLVIFLTMAGGAEPHGRR